MVRQDLIALSLLVLFTGKVFSDNTCDGDWEPYKDEKCLKIFDTEIESYQEAESFCKDKYDANLVSIGVEDKQKFVEDFLKSKNVVDFAWIGLKYESDNNYVWSDGTFFSYSNWADGSPKNNPDYCVQISTDDVEYGKWSDVQCMRRNEVLCEKVQPWSLSQLQDEVMNIKQNLIPIGFIYVQLPKEKPPSEIWSWMTWEDVSSDYESLFFRVAGKNSSSFGDVQEQTSPRITSVKDWNDEGVYYNEIDISPSGEYTSMVVSSVRRCSDTPCYSGLSFKQSADEVRPRNMAIRIWKRTQ